MPRRASFTFALALGWAVLVPGGAARAADARVLVYTTTTERVDPRYLPGPGAPIYYLAMARQHCIGPTLHSAKDNTVTGDDVMAVLEPTLQQQGYRNVFHVEPPARAPKPTLVLLIEYGSMCPVSIDGGHQGDNPGFSGNAMGEAASQGYQGSTVINAGIIGEIIGAQAIGMNEFDYEQRVVSLMDENRYYITISAVDGARALAGDKHAPVIWRARMSIETAATSLRAALQPLVLAGGPYMGKVSGRPRDIGVPEGHVELGTPTVVPPAATP